MQILNPNLANSNENPLPIPFDAPLIIAHEFFPYLFCKSCERLKKI